MSQTEVAEEYKLVIFRAKIVSAVAITLGIPKLIIGFGGSSSFMSITSNESLVLFIIGFSIYAFFAYKFWKCPVCKKFPGGGWSRKTCRNCGIDLTGQDSH